MTLHLGTFDYTGWGFAPQRIGHPVKLLDVTLREEVVYDAVMTVEEKVELAVGLGELGIPIIQLHAQGAGPVISGARARGVKAVFDVICRPYHPYGYGSWQDEILAAIDSGADSVHPSITRPEKWMMGEPGRDTAFIAARAEEATAFGLAHGAPAMVVSFTDAPRSSLDYLIDAGSRVVKQGASRIALQDTVGVAKPALMAFLVSFIKKETKAPAIEVHCHNDFGLGTANTLAAAAAGAEVLDVVVNGADPARSGIAALEEVAVALEALCGVDTGIHLERLTEVAKVFAGVSGIPLGDAQPLVSAEAWSIYSEARAAALRSRPETSLPFQPEDVGQSLHVPAGPSMGMEAAGLRLFLEGCEADAGTCRRVAGEVRTQAAKLGRPLNDPEWDRIAKSVPGSGGRA